MTDRGWAGNCEGALLSRPESSPARTPTPPSAALTAARSAARAASADVSLRPDIKFFKADETYDPGCTRCPRLASFLAESHLKYPSYWCSPVPGFGAEKPKIVIVGLAPGMQGANRTARPFTGDYAGILLYETLHALGMASQPTSTAYDDPLKLINTRIVNAVKCVPPENKPPPTRSSAATTS